MNKYVLLMLALFTSPVSADEPPDWHDFMIQSEKKWSAVVQHQGHTAKIWNDDWLLSVYQGFYLSKPDHTIKPVWTSSYHHSGYLVIYLMMDQHLRM
ncbi:MAG: hypothetical protein VXY56_12085 [Pseudomonadota bacterium]|nr:hypothetical protein [Pseudomonadota bacterium]